MILDSFSDLGFSVVLIFFDAVMLIGCAFPVNMWYSLKMWKGCRDFSLFNRLITFPTSDCDM